VAIPDFQLCMLPMLQLAHDGQEHSLAEAREVLGAHFHLSPEERTELLLSGRQSRFDNRVGWAKTYLDHAGLVQSPRRGRFHITERGRTVLQKAPSQIDIAFLEQFEEFRDFRRVVDKPEPPGPTGDTEAARQGRETPEETLERAYQTIRAELATDLLARVKASSPSFFERLVIELLLKMGYGRSRAEAGRAIGGTGRNRLRRSGGRLAHGCPGVFGLVALLVIPAMVQARPMRWQDAVAALAAARTRAETCGQLLKHYAGKDTDVLTRGALAYDKARADVDEVIAGLIVVLAQRGTPRDLADLETRLTRGVQAREAFCQQVIALVPEDPGTRNLVGELVGAFVKPLVDAVVTVYKLKTEQDSMLRQTIQTQLEATTWAPFADLTP
jgi:Mrr N-terminal domain